MCIVAVTPGLTYHCLPPPGVVHENPRVISGTDGTDLDDVRRAADERYDVVSPVTVRMRNKQRRLSEVSLF